MSPLAPMQWPHVNDRGEPVAEPLHYVGPQRLRYRDFCTACGVVLTYSDSQYAPLCWEEFLDLALGGASDERQGPAEVSGTGTGHVGRYPVRGLQGLVGLEGGGEL